MSGSEELTALCLTHLQGEAEIQLSLSGFPQQHNKQQWVQLITFMFQCSVHVMLTLFVRAIVSKLLLVHRHHSHFHPFGKMLHHLSFLVSLINTIPAQHLITPASFTYMSIKACSKHHSPPHWGHSLPLYPSYSRMSLTDIEPAGHSRWQHSTSPIWFLVSN